MKGFDCSRFDDPFLGIILGGSSFDGVFWLGIFLMGSISGVRYSFFIFPLYFLQGSISGALTLVDIATLNFSASNGVGIMSGDALEAEL